MIERKQKLRPTELILIALEDIIEAFQRLDLSPQAAAMVAVQHLKHNVIPLVLVFGYCGMPMIWGLAERSISHIHNTKLTTWYLPEPVAIEGVTAGSSITYVDDAFIEDTSHSIEQSAASYRAAARAVFNTQKAINDEKSVHWVEN